MHSHSKREAGGVKVLCPWHQDRAPSCQLRPHPGDGTLQAHCFTCGASKNVFQLAGAVWGLEADRDFPGVLDRLAGLVGERPAERPAAAPAAPQRPVSAPRALPYPAGAAAAWERSQGLYGTPAGDYLQARGLDPAAIEDLDLARVLPAAVTAPWWLTRWPAEDRPLVLPVYDAQGVLRSLRGRLIRPPGAAEIKERSAVTTGRTPCTVQHLLFACPTARALLQGERGAWDGRVLLCEGSMDFLALAIHTGESAELRPAILGYYQSAWSQEVADRLPVESQIVIFPHADAGGEGQLLEATRTLGERVITLADLRRGDVAEHRQRGGGVAVQALIEGARPAPAAAVAQRVLLRQAHRQQEARRQRALQGAT